MRGLWAFLVAAPLTACFSPAFEPPGAVYHNPLDVLDAGSSPRDGGIPPADGGIPPGSTASEGSVSGRAFDLASAIYRVEGADGGTPRTLVSLSDVADMCGRLEDGGLPAPWNVVRLYVAGDEPGAYPVAAILPPLGATAEFDWQDGDGGGFGFTTGLDGGVQLDRVDLAGLLTASGSYAVDFGDAGSITGRFVASPCPALPPNPGE